MRRTIGCVITVFFLSGCASQQTHDAYYKSIEAQVKAESTTRMNNEAAYIKAITALKDNPMAILALALTHKSDDSGIDLTGISQPDQFSDVVSSITPIVTTGIAWGLGAWGVSELVGGMGSTYNVSGEGRVNAESTQEGSQNGLGSDSGSDDSYCNCTPGTTLDTGLSCETFISRYCQ